MSATTQMPQRPERESDGLRLWLVRVALLLPAVAIVFAAIPRLGSGIALENAFPATAYMVINVPLSHRTYVAAAKALSQAAPGDGDAQLLRAEAAMRAGEVPSKVIPIVTEGLARSPASPRGWILLADLLRNRDPKRAAEALTLAIELSPNEYYLIVPRVLAGAPLWNDLPADARDRLLSDVRMIVDDKTLRPDLDRLLQVEGGRALLTRAFAGHPDELRALNRELVRKRLGLPQTRH